MDAASHLSDVSDLADLARTEEHVALVDVSSLSRTEEMPAYPAIESVESQTGARPDADGEDGDSDVFVCLRSSPPPAPDSEADELARAAQAAAAANVTLFVYGWDNVEPGPLSWVFPSLRSALDAVRTMRNAVEWSIVSGREHTTIESARESGDVLVEQGV